MACLVDEAGPMSADRDDTSDAGATPSSRDQASRERERPEEAPPRRPT